MHRCLFKWCNGYDDHRATKRDNGTAKEIQNIMAVAAIRGWKDYVLIRGEFSWDVVQCCRVE